MHIIFSFWYFFSIARWQEQYYLYIKEMQNDAIMTCVYSKYSIDICTKVFVCEYSAWPLCMRNTEVSVTGIRYTSGRRGNVLGRIFGPVRCCTMARKASEMRNSANIIPSLWIQRRWRTILRKRSTSVRIMYKTIGGCSFTVRFRR